MYTVFPYRALKICGTTISSFKELETTIEIYYTGIHQYYGFTLSGLHTFQNYCRTTMILITIIGLCNEVLPKIFPWLKFGNK